MIGNLRAQLCWILPALTVVHLWGAQAALAGPPTVSQYMSSRANAKLVAPGKLAIDGRIMRCGARPTVMDSSFESWGGAYPGFVILNPRLIDGLPTAVKRYIFSHECAHQFVGPDEPAADCWAIKRGYRQGWLTDAGMKQICAFISKLKPSALHPPGQERCMNMQGCLLAAKAQRSR